MLCSVCVCVHVCVHMCVWYIYVIIHNSCMTRQDCIAILSGSSLVSRLAKESLVSTVGACANTQTRLANILRNYDAVSLIYDIYFYRLHRCSACMLANILHNYDAVWLIHDIYFYGLHCISRCSACMRLRTLLALLQWLPRSYYVVCVVEMLRIRVWPMCSPGNP